MATTTPSVNLLDATLREIGAARCEKYLTMVMPRYQFVPDGEAVRFDLCTPAQQARVMGWWAKRLLQEARRARNAGTDAGTGESPAGDGPGAATAR